MKINEKNLCMFAVTPPVDLEGYLTKRGEVNKSWQRRYFVLKGNLLFYFDKRGDREPLGVIIIEGCTIELSEDGEQYCFQIVFHGINNRTYFLSAESQYQMEQWMKALTCAGYEYMKLMVSELQRQLDEIDGANVPNLQNAAVTPKPPPRRHNPFNRPAPAVPHTNNGGIQQSPSKPIEVFNAMISNAGAEDTSKVAAPNTTTATHPPTEFSFAIVHEAFGKKIQRDLQERLQKRTLAERPLILL